MIALAISTGIPMSEWLDAGDRAIWTAIELLKEAQQDQARQTRG